MTSAVYHNIMTTFVDDLQTTIFDTFFSIGSFKLLKFLKWVMRGDIPETARIASLLSDRSDRRTYDNRVGILTYSDDSSLHEMWTNHSRRLFRCSLDVRKYAKKDSPNHFIIKVNFGRGAHTVGLLNTGIFLQCVMGRVVTGRSSPMLETIMASTTIQALLFFDLLRYFVFRMNSNT